MTLTDDDIGLPALGDGTDLPEDEEDDIEEEPSLPPGVFSQENGSDPDAPAENPPEPVYGDPSRITAPVPAPAHTSSQSAFQEERYISTGRPRKDGMPPGSVQDDRAITDRHPVPTPRYKDYSNETTNPNQKTRMFYKFWKEWPAWAKDRILVYVYRDHPILNQPEDEEFKYIDKISGNEPITDDIDILNRYGCGNYRLLVNDMNLKGNNKTLCTLRLIGIGGGDYKSNPPNDRRVNDVNQVDRFNPANGSYIKFLQMRGLLPEQNQKKGDEDMPAVVEVLREASATNERLMNKVLEVSADKGKESDVLKEAMSSAIDVMAQSNRIGMETLTKAHEQAREITAGAVPSTQPGKDPLELALMLLDRIQGSRGGDNEERILMLQKEIETMRADRLRELENRVMELMKTKTDNTGLGSLKDTLSNVKELRELMKELNGGENDATEAVAEAAGDMAPKWLRPYVPIISTIAQAAMPAIANWLQPNPGSTPGMAGPGSQYGPGPGVPVPGAPPVVNGGPAQIQGPGPGSAPGSAPAPGPVPVPSPAQQQQAQLNLILQAITYPLLTHLTSPTLAGGDFAEWFADGFGIDTFKQLAGFGEDAVASALLNYQPITQLMQQHAVPTLRFRTFVKEFCETEFAEDGGVDPMPPAGQGPGSGQGPGQPPPQAGPGQGPGPVPA